MSQEVDDLIERRRLRRSLVVWRVAAVVILSALVGVGISKMDNGPSAVMGGSDHVARIYVEGIIVQDRWRDDLLADLKDDDQVQAVVVRIDSPGGTVVGGEELFLGLKSLSDVKPVVAVMGSTATSAAYMAALGTSHIIAREGSLTGSIGVILQTADLTGLMEKLGIKPEIVKSGPLKAQPNPMEPMSDAAREVAQGVILDMHAMFKTMVSSRRELTVDQVKTLADGRIFTGRQALKNGLIDAIGGEKEARIWLETAHAIKSSVPARDAKPDYPDEDWVGKVMGLTGKALFSERLKLDGLLSVWHPAL